MRQFSVVGMDTDAICAERNFKVMLHGITTIFNATLLHKNSIRVTWFKFSQRCCNKLIAMVHVSIFRSVQYHLYSSGK